MQSWLLHDCVKEIVVVDWSSATPVRNSVGPSEKVILVEVKGQSEWCLTLAYNLAARFATKPWLLKLDCDHVILPGFFDGMFAPGSFAAGNWKAARNDNEKHLNGVMMVKRQDFFSVNGYNEFIRSYGWDDCDMYHRLEKSGLTRRDIDNDTARHLEHEDRSRGGGNLFVSIQYNRILCQHVVWDPRVAMSKFSLEKREFGYEARLMETFAVVDRGLSERCWQEANSLKKNTMYINAQNGLGNRLRSIASAFSVVESLNEKEGEKLWSLVIIWLRDETHCGAGFSQLFDTSATESKWPHVKVTEVMPAMPANKLIWFNSKEWMTPDSCWLDRVLQTKRYDLHVYMESSNVIDSPYRSWKSECRFLRELPLAAAVRSKVDDMVERMGGMESMRKIVGVHVRKGQGINADDISEWPKEKQDQWEKWRRASTPEKFLSRMKEDRAFGFYLATDSEDVYELMKKEFVVLYYYPRDKYDRSEEQVISGMIDAIILSKTGRLLVSNWSSFSELAIRMTDSPVEIAGLNF